MTQRKPDRDDDERLLQWLHLRDDHKLSALRISQRYGVTRNSVIGALHRVDKASEAAE